MGGCRWLISHDEPQRPPILQKVRNEKYVHSALYYSIKQVVIFINGAYFTLGSME